MRFYDDDTDRVLQVLDTDKNGLSSEEALKRQAQQGKNKLKEAEKESLFKKFIGSLADPMIIMLIVAAALQAVITVVESKGSFRLGDFADVLVIMIVVVINTAMSLVQENKAEAPEQDTNETKETEKNTDSKESE